VETSTQLNCETGQILSLLTDLCWTVVRLHASPRGGVIVTALKNGRIATLELTLPRPGEPHRAWVERLDGMLASSAYDPTDTAPPVLTVAVSDDVVDLVPQSGPDEA
jgi:hypothetical protein